LLNHTSASQSLYAWAKASVPRQDREVDRIRFEEALDDIRGRGVEALAIGRVHVGAVTTVTEGCRWPAGS